MGFKSRLHLLHRFRLHSDSILRFISDPAVPFSNNIAERAVRMPKVKQKISGCFRTATGANNFCTIRSCLDTLRKQGYSVWRNVALAPGAGQADLGRNRSNAHRAMRMP